MAASSDSESKKSKKEELGGGSSKEDRSSDAAATDQPQSSSHQPQQQQQQQAAQQAAALPPAAAGGTANGAGTASGTQPAASASAKERDYIWTEDAVHVLLDHFLEKYMSYEKGMIRNADWVEIAQRVNQQLEGNKPVKTPEQCKNKVDNLKKQYRKERRRGSLGPSSTNWAFFSRMHDIFESDYKKSGGGAAGGAGGGDAAAGDELPQSNSNTIAAAAAAGNNSIEEAHHHRLRSTVVPDHYLASREFIRKQQEELMQYNKRPSRRNDDSPPPVSATAMPQHGAVHHHHHHPLMLMPDSSHMPFPPHTSNHHHREPGGTPARKKAKSDRQHEPHGIPHGVTHGLAPRHHEPRHLQQPPQQHAEGSGPPSSDSGGGGGAGGGGGGGGGMAAVEGSSKHERKHRHQLAALRRDFMEGFTGFAEVMLKIEVAKMEMQRDLERQRAEMELHRTQMMLSNQLQLAKYLKASPLPHGMPLEGGTGPAFWPNFGFTDGGATNAGGAAGTAGGATPRLQLAIPIFPDFTALDAVGPYEVLHLLPNVEVLFVSHQPGLYAAGMGMLTLQATASFDQVPRPQILVVPGGMGTRRLLQDRVILDWIRKVHEHTLYTASVCTGSLLLGAAGLLKGIEATTHWNSQELLAEFGAKPVSSRIVRQGKIITAAGVSAGIDMALQLAALLTDEATAKTLQLYIEYDPQPPFDSGSVAKAGPELVNRAKELSSKRLQAAAGASAAAVAAAAAAAAAAASRPPS